MAPRVGHFDAVVRILGYLQDYPKGRIIILLFFVLGWYIWLDTRYLSCLGMRQVEKYL